MFYSHRFRSVLLLSGCTLAAPLLAQDKVAPLKPWSAPLYWQPTRAEAAANATARPEAVGTLQPEAQTPAGSLVFVGITPCRVIDTRTGQGFTGSFGPPTLAAGSTRTFPIQSSTNCAIPAIAQAYSFNVTVIPFGQLGFLTVWPTGVGQPLVSTLNSIQGFVVANAAIVPAGTSGSVNVFAPDKTDLIIDINGYYAPQSGITLAQGSAGAPALSFSNDAGTGIFSSGAGILNFSTGGLSRLALTSTGDMDLPGSIRKNGSLFLHNQGSFNTAVGLSALQSNTTGGSNTASGAQALQLNATGANNTASGAAALFSNTTGSHNTAVGISALSHNSTGDHNTAVGSLALQLNTAAGPNTAVGYSALSANTSGNFNTAVGNNALSANTTGSQNSAFGDVALISNTTGANNVAFGTGVLNSNTTGSVNTGVGTGALGNSKTAANNTAVGGAALANSNADSNTAIGVFALNQSVDGINNLAIGIQAMANATTNNNFNTAIGYSVVGSTNAGAGANITTNSTSEVLLQNPGVAGESFTMRLGDSCCQTRTFIAGIRGTQTGSANAVGVVIDSNGQLGTVNSSRRFKEDIQDMGAATDGLLRLRPVTFRYTQAYADGSKPMQYGLVAEEVAEVYPELVSRSNDGQVETVAYQVLDSMLLNAFQREHAQVTGLKEQLSAQREQSSAQAAAQKEEIRSLQQRLARLESMLEQAATPAVLR